MLDAHPSLETSAIACVTSDGLNLAVRRTCANTSEPGPPVVLQHGLGANGLTFELPGRSLARGLAARGFDCYVSELRGAGGSDRPKGTYGLDEYLERDIPAVLNSVRRTNGRESVHWVGHSLGGVLGMFYALEHEDGPIDRMVAVGSALDYSQGPNAFSELRRARWLAGDWLRTLPFGTLARLNALVAGYGPLLPAEKTNFWRSNIEPRVARHFLSRGFTRIPLRLLDDLDTTFSPSGFSRADGRIAYLERTGAFKTPTCLIAASADPQCTAPAIDATAQLLSGAELQVARFGKTYGHLEDYGHMDLLIGRHAEKEVWPTIAGWLETETSAEAN
jgi:pimeloyl-ACP methyl ester carboxylesterase